MQFGERLKAERSRVGLTQEQLASVGDVTVQSQRMYESNKRHPSAKYLELVAAEGVDVQFLLTGHRSVNREVLYSDPTDALDVVVQLQDEFGTFSAEQLKALIGFAWTYQVGKDGLEEFVRYAYTVAGMDDRERKG